MLRNKWITPSTVTTRFLFSIIKREGIDRFEEAITELERNNFKVQKVNDITSRIVILHLSNISRNLQKNLSKNIRDSNTRDLIKSLVKEIADE